VTTGATDQLVDGHQVLTAVTPATGYPDEIDTDGIPVRDRVWRARPVPTRGSGC
jgi:hypothetical protein